MRRRTRLGSTRRCRRTRSSPTFSSISTVTPPSHRPEALSFITVNPLANGGSSCAHSYSSTSSHAPTEDGGSRGGYTRTRLGSSNWTTLCRSSASATDRALMASPDIAEPAFIAPPARVAVIGLGAMGGGIAGSLVHAGFTVVGHDLDDE